MIGFYFLIVLLIMAALQVMIPFIVKGTIVFGVTVPDQFVHHERLQFLKRRYAMIVAGVTVLAAAVAITVLVIGLPETTQVIVNMVALYVVIVMSMVVYFVYHVKVQQLKRVEAWGKELRQVRVVDTSVRERDEMVPWTFIVLPMLLSVSLMVYTWLNYDKLPPMIPVHWGANGMADAWTGKTWVTAVSTPITFFIMQWLFAGVIDAMKQSGIRVSVNMREQSIERQLTIRRFSNWFFVGLTYVLTAVMTVVQLSIIHEQLSKSSVLTPVFLGVTLFTLGGVLLYAWQMYKMRLRFPKELQSNLMDVDEDRFWKGGLIYYNPDDPSVFVEKRFGIGWTMNMANKRGYVTFVLPLILLLLFTLFFM